MCDGNLRMAECMEPTPDPYDYFKAMGLEDNEAIIAEYLAMETKLKPEQIISCVRGNTSLEDEIATALSQRISVSSLAKGEPSEMQKLQWKNKALEDALKYLVETKERRDTTGRDSIYLQRKKLGWMKARNLLRSLEDER